MLETSSKYRVLKEIGWLALAMLFAVGVVGLSITVAMGNLALDVRLHDLYFAIPEWSQYLVFGLLSMPFFALFEAIRWKFRSRSHNLALLVSSVLFFIFIGYIWYQCKHWY